jgi:hypothetical protein
MAKYYNKTRGPLAVSLSSGASAIIPPKTWVEIDAADAGSPDMISLVGRGYLVKSKVEELSAPAEPVAPEAPVPAPAPEPVKAPPAESMEAPKGAVDDKPKKK